MFLRNNITMTRLLSIAPTDLNWGGSMKNMPIGEGLRHSCFDCKLQLSYSPEALYIGIAHTEGLERQERDRHIGKMLQSSMAWTSCLSAAGRPLMFCTMTIFSIWSWPSSDIRLHNPIALSLLT